MKIVTDDLQKRIQAALANPQNMGEMAGADSIGTVGNADCGEMLRLWVKFKQQDGKRVIDRATFKEVRRIPLGTDPRGIAVNKSSREKRPVIPLRSGPSAAAPE